MMPQVSKDSGSYVKQNELGPDYFGYYKQVILELFSQNEDHLSPSTCQGPDSFKVEGIGNYNCNNRKAKICSGSGPSGSLFSDGIGKGLSDSKRERVKTYLKQCVIDLNGEVNEMLDCVLAVCRIQDDRREKEPSLCHLSASDKDMSKRPCKKQKSSTSPPSYFAQRHSGIDGFLSNVQVNEGFESLLTISGLQSEEALRKFSDGLSTKLENMEQSLQEFLDIVMSRCRSMSLVEKQQLCKRIQKLPAKALDRVVEIVHHRKPSSRLSCDEIHVDLDKEENVTLWRLHYYVEAVERANERTSLQGSHFR